MIRFLATTILILIHCATTAAVEVIAGKASVQDGDTIVVRGVPIRLEGIDAPETDQFCLDAAHERYPCGLRARAALEHIIGAVPVVCRLTGLDRFGRVLAYCSAAGIDIAGAMVEAGWALAFVRYSTAYLARQERARGRRAGLWAGSFIAPWDWRTRSASTGVLGTPAAPIDLHARLVLPGERTVPPVAGCRIKGNINRHGEHIYHVPGMQFYERTIIDRRRGERWFCTEREAIAAGWRRSRR